MTVERNARRVALITGGSRGVGAGAASALARHGCDVALTYRNKVARAIHVVEEIEQHGRRAMAIQSDITSAAERERL